MNMMKNLIAITSLMALLTGHLQAQDQPYYDNACDDACAAYCDGGCATTLSIAIPVAALAIAAILIATTDHHHHHHSGSSCSSSSNIIHCH